MLVLAIPVALDSDPVLACGFANIPANSALGIKPRPRAPCDSPRFLTGAVVAAQKCSGNGAGAEAGAGGHAEAVEVDLFTVRGFSGGRHLHYLVVRTTSVEHFNAMARASGTKKIGAADNSVAAPLQVTVYHGSLVSATSTSGRHDSETR